MVHQAVRILLIEDNPDEIELLEKKLLVKHELFFASSLTEGVEQCNRLKPDVIMADLGLPDSSGYKQTLQELGKVRCKAAVVIITGYDATREMIDDCIRFNADGFIVKGRGDRTPELLEAAISEAVAHRKRQLLETNKPQP